ncbi:condensin-2 complex subunit H2, partial [Protobothrops mucrosquamatus]|uniref:condensin-2 complex subunit H2 n=1 Tax=Protobothrops mucrosquamatus TaxID=103944 RepID=UPI0010FB32D8
MEQDPGEKKIANETDRTSFLSLDDIQQASRTNVDLRDDQQQHVIPVVPLTPMALVPPEDSDKKDNPLFSRKGELLASRKDFRMNTCTPQNNGLFRLDLAGRSPTRGPAGRNGDWGRADPNDLEELYWRGVKERLVARRKLQKKVSRRNSLKFLNSLSGPGEVPSSVSYEELFSRNVELFMAHSQKYTRETVLSQRVRDWEEMMGPQLEEQESRSAFDIHSYGDQLVTRFSRLGEWHSFASLLAGQPAFEVCRAMLASLQL